MSKIQRAALARDIEEELEIVLWVLWEREGSQRKARGAERKKIWEEGKSLGKGDYLVLLNRLPC